ncbi:DUF4249 domain-containing protein [Roseivirga pacifica]|uniref:DUF4249 domain-containing protein n=1 Tax=Roseivirga pacifica TaxID=1267423 RepID=UPI00227B1368|nr:DUF4249 domain-containing protein [Roseivirga pacifica]
MNKNNLKKTLIIGLVWLVASITACVEEFETDSINFEKLLVVDANISDQAKAHEVRLTYTTPIDDDLVDQPSALSGATVWVEDDLGTRTNFTEAGLGTYYSPRNFAGQIGRSYALFITTPDGRNYQSDFESMSASPEITRVYNQFSIELGDGDDEATPGAQFFIDVENASQGSQFYRYEWTDAHQILVPTPKVYEAVRDNNGNYQIVPFDEDVSECYREGTFNELILATSTNNNSGDLVEVPIKFSPASGFGVTTAYSIEVTQRAISAEAYSYYRKIELFNESNGTLFDKQQGTVIGNVKSVDFPDEKVLGYFEVSGAKSKRVFLQLSDFDQQMQDEIFRTCSEYGAMSTDQSIEAFYQAADLPEELRGSALARRSLYTLYDYFPSSGEKFFSHRDCNDCRRNGNLRKPDYWP